MSTIAHPCSAPRPPLVPPSLPSNGAIQSLLRHHVNSNWKTPSVDPFPPRPSPHPFHKRHNPPASFHFLFYVHSDGTRHPPLLSFRFSFLCAFMLTTLNFLFPIWY